MKNFLMIAVLALIAPLAYAEDQATTEATNTADVAAVEVTEAAATTDEGTVEAVEVTEETEAATDAAK